MSKFDTRCNEILNEAGRFMGTLGNIAGGVNKVASAVGSGINSTEKPFQGTANLIKGLAGYGKEQEQRTQTAISVKNPVKKEEIVSCNTPIYSIKEQEDPRDPTKKMQVWDLQQMTITGVALSDSNKVNGSFQVKLNETGGKKLVFFTYTELSAARRGQPSKSTSVVVVGIDGIIPDKYKIPTPTPIAMVGPMQNVDHSLQNWYIVPKNPPKA
jgi:hypothetical protein